MGKRAKKTVEPTFLFMRYDPPCWILPRREYFGKGRCAPFVERWREHPGGWRKVEPDAATENRAVTISSWAKD